MSKIECEIMDIDNKILKLTKKQKEFNKNLSNLKNKRIKLLQESSKQNIGRCFKKLKDDKVMEYCKIVDIDSLCVTASNISFNEYQYPSLYFAYPYDNSINPFFKDKLFSGAWGKGIILNDYSNIKYIEITNDEYMEKFNEVYANWISNINQI